MNSTLAGPASQSGGSKNHKRGTSGPAPKQSLAALPFGLTILFLAFIWLPSVRANPRLAWTFVGVGMVLLGWQAVLRLRSLRWTDSFRIEFKPVKSHYVQASVQLCIYAYWGWYWPKVYGEAHLILAQVLFLYIFDALLSWSRNRAWRLGFGPLPIIFSTNLFMWFKDDWFVFQFLMVATGALGKEFIKWQRDGKQTHIFNPSAFGLALFSLVLMFTGTTHYTWGEEVATLLALPPYIYVEIFLLGLVVQYLFSVTLMTLSAAGVLCLLNLLYTRSTGVYMFIDSNIPIAVFLGLHLLMTDPSTSPRTNIGKVLFGGLYGLGVFVSYEILTRLGLPSFYDKLVVVPFLNLGVQVIDRVARRGMLARFARWEAGVGVRKLNLGHMACWMALFLAMLSTGFVQGLHPGSSIAFWKQACEEGRPRARENLITLLQDAVKRGSGEAANELGLLLIEGKFAEKNPTAAAQFFSQACELGYTGGCANAAIQYLFYGQANSPADLGRALDQLEKECNPPKDGRSCYLVGFAYENGRGRPTNKSRARELYLGGYKLDDLGACKNLARMLLAGEGGPVDPTGAAQALEKACAAKDGPSCMYLAAQYHNGNGVPRNEERGLALLTQACELGVPQACQALKGLKK